MAKKGEEHDPILAAHGDDQRLTGFNRRYQAYVFTDRETNSFSVEKELYDKMEIGYSIKYKTYKLGNVKVCEIDGKSIE